MEETQLNKQANKPCSIESNKEGGEEHRQKQDE